MNAVYDKIKLERQDNIPVYFYTNWDCMHFDVSHFVFVCS